MSDSDKPKDEKPATEQVDEKTALKDEIFNDSAASDYKGEFDSSKVQFINGGAKPEVRVDLDGENNPTTENHFVGLSKEELMKFATDPFWVRLRWGLLILFWVVWFGMLLAAVLIIIFAPKCPPVPSLSWWQKSSGYEVFPESFKDSDSDGVGDLSGIHEQIEYFKELNVDAVYLNTIIDDTDFKTVKADVGNLENLKSLIIAFHKNGMRVVLDFIPTYTGLYHSWFNESRKGSDNEFSNYYVWHQASPGDPPPNNWLSVYGGSAWTYDDQRGAYYLHHFLDSQPELNLTNPAVKNHISEAMTFWLKQGADGFRIKNFPYLIEGSLDVNEPVSGKAVSKDDYDYLMHNVTTYQPGSFQLITEWRALLQKYSDDEGRKNPRLLMVEANDATKEQIENIYSYEGKAGANMPINSKLLDLDSQCGAQCIHEKIREWTSVVSAGQTEHDRWSNWQTGTSDVSRISTRVTETYSRAINLLLLTLPGASVSYYGEEIGMHDVSVSWEETQDPVAKNAGQASYLDVTRDPYRTPMQWNGGSNAGFSDSVDGLYLPLASDYESRNVQAQSAHGSGITELEVFQSLTKVRKSSSFLWGIMEDVYIDSNILSFVRQAEGFEGYLVAINFGPGAKTVDFHSASPKFVPAMGEVVTSTSNFDTAARMDDFKSGTEVSLKAVYLKPGEGFVVKFQFEK